MNANDPTAEPLARSGSAEKGGGAFVFREADGETFSFEATGATTNGDPDRALAQFPDGLGPLCEHTITCLSAALCFSAATCLSVAAYSAQFTSIPVWAAGCF